MNKIDLEPLRKAVRTIDAHPETWEQSAWGVTTGCGTAYCVAGYIVHQAPNVKEHWSGDVLVAATIGSVPLEPEAAAMDICGIDLDAYSQAGKIMELMFECENTRADIQYYAEKLAALVGETWDVPLPDWADPYDSARDRELELHTLDFS